MDNRLNLQAMLEEILGGEHVYFQPPESIRIQYPAIIYSRANFDNKHANNAVYLSKVAYEVTVVDYDPDSEIVDKISKLSNCKFVRHYASDNLNHDVFTLFY